MDNKKAQKIANNIMQKKAYMVLKVPVGYALLKNSKDVLQKKIGIGVQDEDLEEIFARFIDLVIFGLMKDTENVGTSMPSADAFVQVAEEVLQDNYDDSEDFEDSDFDDDSESENNRY
jgi:hypothetical protein